MLEKVEYLCSEGFDVATKAFVMYQNFVNLTEAIKNRANKLIYAFNFPIQLPDFYKPETGLQETLKVILKGLKEEKNAPQLKAGDKSSKPK